MFQLHVVQSFLRRVDRDDRDLTRQKQEVAQQINARYDVLMTWARRSRDELLEEVSAKEDSARSQLRAEKTAATVTVETLSALVSRAARVTGKDPDVVALRNELQAALLSEDRLDHHLSDSEPTDRSRCGGGGMTSLKPLFCSWRSYRPTWGGWWRGAVLTSPGPCH